MFDFVSAEYSAIGCILIDARCLPVVREHIPAPAAFTLEPCQRAYQAVCTLADEGKPIDPVTVGRTAGLEREFLVQCMEIVPSCDGASQYAAAVAEGYRRRQLQEIGNWLQAGAQQLDTDADQLLSQARSALDTMAEAPGSTIAKTTADSLYSFLDFRAEVNAGTRQTVKTGFTGIDNILGGFARGGLYIVAARPGVGKSAFGIAMADMIARDYSVLYVSLEMTEEELNARRVAAFSGRHCTYTKLLFGRTTEEEDCDIIDTCGVLSRRNLRIAAVSGMTVAQLEIQARNVHAQVVMADYLGLLSGTDPKASEYDRITQISGDLKRMAKRLGCVVIALCQLNQESAMAGCDKPRLSQLRSSGAIEQDADGVLLLHRPEYGKTEVKRESQEPQRFQIDVAKNRHGRTGGAELFWYAPVNRFEDRSGKWTIKSWIW